MPQAKSTGPLLQRHSLKMPYRSLTKRKKESTGLLLALKIRRRNRKVHELGNQEVWSGFFTQSAWQWQGWIQDFTWVISTNLTGGVWGMFPQENLGKMKIDEHLFQILHFITIYSGCISLNHTSHFYEFSLPSQLFTRDKNSFGSSLNRREERH